MCVFLYVTIIWLYFSIQEYINIKLINFYLFLSLCSFLRPTTDIIPRFSVANQHEGS